LGAISGVESAEVFDMDRGEAYEIVSLGARLRKRNKRLWRKVEEDALGDRPYYIPARIPRGRKGEERQFLVLYSGGDPIARALVVSGGGREAGDEGGENIGYICEFVVLPDYRDRAGALVDRCLAILRDHGVQGVVVKSGGFPALAAQEMDDLPPDVLPDNPPWYVGLFEERGFTRHKEWGNFRMTVPRETAGSGVEDWDEQLAKRGMKLKKVDGRSRKDLKQFADVSYDVLSEHYGYTPWRFMNAYSLIRSFLFMFASRIAKIRVYMVCNESGEAAGFFSWHPQFNFVRYELRIHSQKNWYDPSKLKAIPNFITSIRRAKRAAIGSIGIRADSRGRGLIRAMDYSMVLVQRDGYESVDTGPVLIENAVVVKMIQRTAKMYGIDVRQTTYYTLQYDF
jgi:GNAT superfamily N-acetyltransferase